jgi:hypothetical protein
LLKSEVHPAGGVWLPSLHCFRDRELSVDWLEKTTIEDAYGRKKKAHAHVTMSVARLHLIEDTEVVHDPEVDNPAHSLVENKTGRDRDAPMQLRLYREASEAILRADVVPAEPLTPNVVSPPEEK